MCGLVGFIHSDQNKPANQATIQSMCDILHHRGPDSSGIYTKGNLALGHRRLSIIDLSTAGNQPFVSESGRYIIVYNGEIFNYRSLREELRGQGETFRSRRRLIR